MKVSHKVNLILVASVQLLDLIVNSNGGGIILFVREGIQAKSIFSDIFNCFSDCSTVNFGPFSRGQPH